MNDPHVVRLRYKLVTGGSVSYNRPPPVSFGDSAFDLKLEDGILTAEMKEHHSSVGSAIERVRPAIRAWEIHAALTLERGALRFEYDSAELVDRVPPPPSSGGPVALSAAIVGLATVSANLNVLRPQYPAPPTAFKVTPLVELLWSRYERYLDGKEPLTTMGYFCLSAVQAEAHGKRRASNQYAIDEDVLTKLGELTSVVGTGLTARKLDARSTKRAHTPGEQYWIAEAVKTLIRRVAEYDYNPGAPLTQITMADLPKL